MPHRRRQLCLAAILAATLALAPALPVAAVSPEGHGLDPVARILERIATWIVPWNAGRDGSEVSSDPDSNGVTGIDSTPTAPADDGSETTTTISGTEGEVYPDMDPNG